MSLADALALGTAAQQPRPARRPAAARAGDARAPTRRARPLGARAPARRRARRSRPSAASSSTARWRHAPRRLRLRLARLIYEGRLGLRSPGCERQSITAPGTLTGTGHALPARRARRQRPARREEAERIARQVAELLDGGYLHDRDGATRELTPRTSWSSRPTTPRSAACASRLPDGVRVGTVDKFQGQEAPVVFFSMATSSGEELPRNLEFLFSRNRLNVAVSRARCLAVRGREPALLDVRVPDRRADAAGERAVPGGGGGRKCRHSCF